MNRQQLYIDFEIPFSRSAAFVVGDEGLDLLKAISTAEDHKVFVFNEDNLLGLQENFFDIDLLQKFTREDLSLYVIKSSRFSALADFVESFFLISFENIMFPFLKSLLGEMLSAREQIKIIDHLISSTKGDSLRKAIEVRDAIRRSYYYTG